MQPSGQSLTRTTVVLVLIALLTACATSNRQAPAQADADMVTIKGKLAYRERIALPPNAVARVTVRDVSLADHKAPLIAHKTLHPGDRQVPIAFELAVPRANLEARRRYSLHATIKDADGHLLWTTDTAHRIDRDQAVNDLGTLWLVQAGTDSRHGVDLPHQARGNEPGSLLTGTEWVVENIADGGIIDSSRVTLNFGPNGQLSGRASCNTYHGQYELTGERLKVGQMAMTMMACAPALNKQEQRFTRILQNAQGFDISDQGKLIIRSDAGKTLEAWASE